ncbi:retropepsin-like aspartic protease family protein [Sphingomonas jaspsi]|uniref:retropepsin-like aspartic protease family protein n=1 Tax=Sphingomonas jaspsi TaxID=392409 RepID=UPI00146F9C96|nr:TIGR02281 family clan AA aspartic protease [Sphingomonas jaspsi]
MMAPADMGKMVAPENKPSVHTITEESSYVNDPDVAPSQAVDTMVGQKVVIPRDRDGQFHLDASVNGQALPFLVDTGADLVALTVDDARRIGIVVEPQSFQHVGTGAGGAVRGQPIMIDHLTVAGHEISQVQGVVIDGLTTNLLGQSVLRQMGSLQLSGDTMTLD